MKKYQVDYGMENSMQRIPLKADNLEDAKKEAVENAPSWHGICVTVYELTEVAVVYLDEDRSDHVDTPQPDHTDEPSHEDKGG